jgi:hypothetical protein
MNRNDEAVSVYDMLAARFDQDHEPEIRDIAAQASLASELLRSG